MINLDISIFFACKVDILFLGSKKFQEKKSVPR